jgi:hypothetical protein
MMTNEEAKARLAIVNSEIEVYFSPKADGYDKDDTNKPLSAKHFDDLFKEKAMLNKQLGDN